MRHWRFYRVQAIRLELRRLGGKMGKWVYLLLGALLSFGCQKQNSSSHLEVDQLPVDYFASPSELSSALNRWKVQCADPKNCPDSVAQLLVTDGKSLSLCTATLVEDDVALSNSHCFDMRNRRTQRYLDPDQLCQAGTRIVFAENSKFGNQQIRCKKILKKSFISVNYQYPDYLLFQLEKTAGRPFDQVSRRGLQNNLRLQIRKVNPVRRGLGRLEVLECQIQHQTLLAPKATTDHYHIHSAKNCTVESGNSGASLVDQNGLIRGLIFKGIGVNSSPPRTDFEIDFRKKALNLKASLITNATCISYDFSGVDRYDERQCLSYQMIEDTLTDGLNFEKLKQQYFQSILSIAQSYPSVQTLGYQLILDPVTKEFVYHPFCIRPVLDDGFSGYLPNTVTLNIDNLYWKPQIQVSSQLQAEVREFKLSTRKCQITYSPVNFKNQKQGIVQLSGSGCRRDPKQSDARQEVWSICQ